MIRSASGSFRARHGALVCFDAEHDETLCCAAFARETCATITEAIAKMAIATTVATTPERAILELSSCAIRLVKRSTETVASGDMDGPPRWPIGRAASAEGSSELSMG
jgi:hypothetical protein